MTDWRFHSVMINAPDTTPWPRILIGTQRLWDCTWGGVNSHWAQVETAQGVYNWTVLDAVVALYQTHNVDLIYCFADVPGWANGNAGRTVLPTNQQYAFDFATAVATRYAGKIKYYELWNEPSGTAWSDGENYITAAMLSMVTGLAAAIRAADPSALIGTPSANGFNGPWWMDSFMAAGGNMLCDLMICHFYPAQQWFGYAPEQIWQMAATYAAIRSHYGMVVKPFYWTEGSYSNAVTDEPTKQAWSAIAALLASSAGVNNITWYAYDNAAWGEFWDGTSQNGLNTNGQTYREVQKWLIDSTWTSPLARIAGTNGIRNTTGSGVVPGTPGTVPTDWKLNAPDSAKGISTALGTATVNGRHYITWRVWGTSTTGASGSTQLDFEQSTQIAATQGQKFTLTAYLGIASGVSTTNALIGISWNEMSNTGAYLVSGPAYEFPLYSDDPIGQVKTLTGVVANASTAYLQPFVKVNYTVGNAFNVTLLIGADPAVPPSMDSGTTWTGTLTKADGTAAQVAWDASGSPVSHSAGSYSYFRDYTGVSQPVVGGSVTLTQQPILLETAAWSGTSV